MRRMTIELIRKRSEHNEGEIHSLEELALHQEKLEKIENLDKWCRGLRVLLLQNNNINRIENLSRLKCLEYLNLALNNIELIEGLEGCESLKKLDLTLNFIGQISCVNNLRQNYFLEQLHLTGNPCTDFSGYRNYVIDTLPQIKVLDGIEIVKSEKIKAKQAAANMQHSLLKFEKEQSEKREVERKMPLNEDIEGDDFWERPSLNTPEARAQIQKRMELDDEKHVDKKTTSGKDFGKEPRKVRKFFAEDGRPYNINEAKYSFTLHDDAENGTLVVELDLPKYLDTSLVNADVQPSYVRVIIKTKIFQLCLPEEVRPDCSTAQRSRTNGHLVITMPKYDQEKIIEIFRKQKINNDSPPPTQSETTRDKMKKESQSQLEPGARIGRKEKWSTKTDSKNLSSDLLYDDDVPPLV